MGIGPIKLGETPWYLNNIFAPGRLEPERAYGVLHKCHAKACGKKFHNIKLALGLFSQGIEKFIDIKVFPPENHANRNMPASLLSHYPVNYF